MCDSCSFIKTHRCHDIFIFRLVGAATYGQLLDHFPGLYEPFVDYRSKGFSSSSLTNFNFYHYKEHNENDYHVSLPYSKSVFMDPCNDKEILSQIPKLYFDEEFISPTPPNLVSSVFLESGLEPCEFKTLLLKYGLDVYHDKRVEGLVSSSRCYKEPKSSLYDVTSTLLIYFFLVFIFYCYMKYLIKRK